MKKLFIILLSLGFIWSCSNDDDNGGTPTATIPVATVDPTDPAAVSTELGASNSANGWVAVSGDPAASNGAIAVSSNTNGDTVFATNGLSIAIDVSLDSGDTSANMILFQVLGVTAHYEVPTEPDGKFGLFPVNSGNVEGFSGRLIKKENENSGSGQSIAGNQYLFIFNIPSSIKPGTFCVRFAASNGTGGVSNYVNTCIQLQQRGGAGSGNLTGKRWRTTNVKYYDMNDILEEEDLYGVPITSTDTFFCQQGGIEIYTTTDENHLYFNFNVDGTFSWEEMEVYTELNYDSSSCGNLIIEPGTETYEETGGWSYDNAAKTLTLAFDGYIDDEGYYVEPYTFHFEVISSTSNMLVLKFGDGGTDYGIVTLVHP